MEGEAEEVEREGEAGSRRWILINLKEFLQLIKITELRARPNGASDFRFGLESGRARTDH